MSTSSSSCPECSGRLDESGDETTCLDCGLVVAEDRVDRGPEWRSFADDAEERERTGAPLTRTRHDRGLSTEIGSTRSVGSGRKQRRLARMRTQHDRTKIKTKAERNQVYGFTEIRRIVSELSLPDSVQEMACKLFDSAQEDDLLRGRSIEGFAAATVYAACRTATVSRTREEVTDTAKADAGELDAAYRALNQELGLPVGPIHPREYLPRFACQLDLDAEVEGRARELANDAVENGVLRGRNPSGFAAACLYTAARELGADCTQEAAADVGGIAAATLRSSFYDLRE